MITNLSSFFKPLNNSIRSKPSFNRIFIKTNSIPHNFQQTFFKTVRPVLANGIPNLFTVFFHDKLMAFHSRIKRRRITIDALIFVPMFFQISFQFI